MKLNPTLATALLSIVLLAGCAKGITRVDNGAHDVGTRLTLNIDGPWNYLEIAGSKPAQVWTMEGIYVDELLVYSGIADGQAMHADNGGGKQKSFVFRKAMQTEEIVSLFEGTLTRDGSLFRLVKVEPYTFGGRPGFRFEFELTRKFDNVQLRGVGYGAVDHDELFALVYQAPRLTFFERQRARIEAIARGAMIRG